MELPQYHRRNLHQRSSFTTSYNAIKTRNLVPGGKRILITVAAKRRTGKRSGSSNLPEVLYEFLDSNGNSAVVTENGIKSTIAIVQQPALHSFDERDYDPASSQPILPTAILAPRPSRPLTSDTSNSNGQPQTPTDTLSIATPSNSLASIEYTNTKGNTSAASISKPPAAAHTSPSSPAPSSPPSRSLTTIWSPDPTLKTIIIRAQDTTNPFLSALFNLFRWPLTFRTVTHGSPTKLLQAAPSAVNVSGDSDGGDDSSSHSHASSGASRTLTGDQSIDGSSGSDSDGAATDIDDDGAQCVDPLVWGVGVLAAAVVAVSGIMLTAAAAATAVTAAAAAATVPPATAAEWVGLNLVPGVAAAAAEASRVDWFVHGWTELCNLVLEPLSRMFQKWSYAALPVKIVFVLASSVPLVLVFGMAYYFAVGGKSAGQSFSEALVKIHCILNRMPGTNMVRESNAVSFLVVNLAFFTGLFTFAIFLGIVSDEVKTTFRSIKTGTFPVRVRDHILVLNWSHHTIPLLRQFDLARKYAGNDGFFRRPVVLLSDNPKLDMDNEIAERLKGSNLDVVTRSGSPAMLRDLSTVAATRAHTVIVLHPGGAPSHGAAEAAKASTAMALAALVAAEVRQAPALRPPLYGSGSITSGGAVSSPVSLFDQLAQPLVSPGDAYPVHGGGGGGGGGGGMMRGRVAAVRMPRVLFQMPDEVLTAHDPVSSFTRTSPANASGRMQALSITDASVIDRFTCQAAVQPGMLRIWSSVLQHGPHSVKALVVPVPPALIGSTFATARCSYQDAVLIGVLSGPPPSPSSPSAASFGFVNPNSAAVSAQSCNGTITPNLLAMDSGAATDSNLIMDVRELECRTLGPGDQLVMFAPARVAGAPQPQPCTAALFRPAAAAAAERLKRHGGYNAPAKRVIMAGYGWRDVPDVAAAFADSAPDGSQITFILPALPTGDEHGSQELPYSSGSCRIRYVDVRGSMLSLKALSEAGIKAADAVVLRPPIQEMERWCSDKPVTSRIREADAMVMAGLVQVQDAVIASGRTDPPHVVARFNRYGCIETTLRYFEMLSKLSPHPSQPTMPSTTKQHPAPPAAAASPLQHPQTQTQEALSQGPPKSTSPAAAAAVNQITASVPNAPLPATALNVGGSGSVTGPTATTPPPPPSSSIVGTSTAPENPLNGGGGGQAAAAVGAVVTSSIPGTSGPAGGGGGGAHSVTAAVGVAGSEDQSGASGGGGGGGIASGGIGGGAGAGSGITSPHQSDSAGSHQLSGGGGGATGVTTSGSVAGTPVLSMYDKRPIIRNPEIFLADDLIGALLTQVAAQPHYAVLVSHLIKKEGVELYLRNPAVFNIAPGERLSFAELSETTWLLRQIALGVVRVDGRCCLVPKPQQMLDIEPGDQILVLSDDYRIRKK